MDSEHQEKIFFTFTQILVNFSEAWMFTKLLTLQPPKVPLAILGSISRDKNGFQYLY